MNDSLFLGYFESGSWVQFAIVGIVAGLMLDLILRGNSYGFLGNSLIGFAGAIVGSFVWDKVLKDKIKIDIGQATIQFNMVLVALLGAAMLLLIIKMIERGKQKRG